VPSRPFAKKILPHPDPRQSKGEPSSSPGRRREREKTFSTQEFPKREGKAPSQTAKKEEKKGETSALKNKG